jgi:hypothetical protein
LSNLHTPKSKQNLDCIEKDCRQTTFYTTPTKNQFKLHQFGETKLKNQCKSIQSVQSV